MLHSAAAVRASNARPFQRQVVNVPFTVPNSVSVLRVRVVLLVRHPAACLGELSAASSASGWGKKMATTETSWMYKRTLRAGITVGLVGVFIMLFSNVFMQTIGTVTYNGANGFFFALTQIYLLAPVVCISFSAALVSAALVMRHLNTAGVRPAGQQPADESRA